MKTLSCKQLGGTCSKKISGNSFEEIAELSKAHETEIYQAKDAPHIETMSKMMELMKSPEAMMVWFDEKEAAFNALAKD
jgi:predicted small metal-binding protein